MNGRSMTMIGNEGPVLPIEVTWFSTPEEGATKSPQNEDHFN